MTMHASRGLKGTTRPAARSVQASPAFLGKPVLPVARCPTHGAHARSRPAPALRAASAARSAVLVEANLFSRLARVVKAYVGNFTEQFEDPEVMLDRVTDEMQEDLIKMRQATAKVMASEKQMQAKYNASQATADEWLRRAELAVRKGQDELAREALLRRKTYETAAQGLKVQLDAQSKAREQLQANVGMLEARLNEARNKRETLKARAASAKSSKQIQEMVAGLRINNSSAWAAFDKMEEKVMALEAEADSAGVLASPDRLEAQFAMLEGGTVEDELAALKQGRLAVASSASSSRGGQQAQSLGRPVSEVLVREPARQLQGIDAELEQLRKRARSQ
ncbi:chloroplast vesicle-inducing protein in plastids 1 [Scenedesmus sp. NREL 46B-D3]|nr:chloroplast vesicle-inducing protein in plastids 1 [Scenedesmus sp. NREL 46B-D3]